MNAIHVHVLNVMLFLASHRQGPPHTEQLWQADVPSCCRKPFFVGASGWPGLSPAMTLAQLWWLRENNSRPAHFSLTLRHMLMGARRHTISCTLSYGQSAHTAKGGGCMNREHSKVLCGKTKKPAKQDTACSILFQKNTCSTKNKTANLGKNESRIMSSKRALTSSVIAQSY